MKMGLRIEGMRDLDEALKQLPRATGRSVLDRALKRAAKPIQQKSRALAPRDTGALRKSIVVESVKRGNRAGKSAFAQALAAGGSVGDARAALVSASSGGETRAEVRVGPRKGKSKHESIKTIVQEFGSVNQPAQPYMRPAWDANRDAASANIRKELWSEIEKAVARRAKRAAAKGG